MTQRWLPQRDDQYYGQKLHLRVCKRSMNRPSAAALLWECTVAALFIAKSYNTCAKHFHFRRHARVWLYRRFLFASSEDQAKVVLQSIYHNASHFFVILSYNREVIDVALSFRSADKLRYQSQKKRSFYERTFVRRCDLSVEIRHDKLRVGNRWNMNITWRILFKTF
jgi:hypothetical protein